MLLLVSLIAIGLLVLLGFSVRALIVNHNIGFVLACSFLNFITGFLVAICHESLAYKSPTVELISQMQIYYLLMIVLYLTGLIGLILVLIRFILKISRKR